MMLLLHGDDDKRVKDVDVLISLAMYRERERERERVKWTQWSLKLVLLPYSYLIVYLAICGPLIT